jgi:hypothetical protein
MDGQTLKPVPILVKETYNKHADGTYLSEYKCICGDTFLAVPRHIAKQKTVSCGCYRKSGGAKCRIGKSPGNALEDPTYSSFNGFYLSYVNSSRRNNRGFSLSRDEFRIISQKLCFYCNESPLDEHRGTKWARKPYVGSGIDRYDNTKGYTIENMRPCCKRCNYLKSDMHGDDFIALIHKISNNLVGAGKL